MNIKNLTAGILLFFSSSLFARDSELGFFLGCSGYTGDLHPVFLDLNPHFLHPAAGIIYRYNIHKHISWKGNIYYGRISADDALESDGFRKSRNLSFRTTIIEGSWQLEFNFLPYQITNPDYPFTPYIFTGLSVFYFNPKTYYNGSWEKLQPLATEGKKYSRIQLALPMGMGLKMNVGKMCLGIEAGARKAFTDYLDDVSTTYTGTGIKGDAMLLPGRQRGNSRDKDWYFFTGMSLTFKITGKISDCDAFPK